MSVRSLSAVRAGFAATAALLLAGAASAYELAVGDDMADVPAIAAPAAAPAAPPVTLIVPDTDAGDPVIHATLSNWSPPMAPLPPAAMAPATGAEAVAAVAPAVSSTAPAAAAGPVESASRGGIVVVILVGVLLVAAALGAALLVGSGRPRSRQS
ncbi:MAG: hypothetical protein INF91_07765 [Alphaproteobacteria bacterium]|nr:hypothetical protein [Alphaproteobacteria bacterium]